MIIFNNPINNTKVVNGNTEVTVGNWVFYFHGNGEFSKLVEIYHKRTDLEAKFDKQRVLSFDYIIDMKPSFSLPFTHPTMGDFQLRGGFEIKKEAMHYVDGSDY